MEEPATISQPQLQKSRAMAIVGIVISVAIIGFMYIGAFSRAWGCGGSIAYCNFVPQLNTYFQLAVYIFIIYCIEQSIAGQSSVFRKVFVVFLVLASLWAGLLLVLSSDFGDRIERTELGCSLVGEIRVRDRCYTALAQARNDIRLCERLSEFEQVAGECFKSFALKEKNAALCREQDGYCIQAVAEATKDGELCGRIQQDYPRQQCYAIVAGLTGDKSLCRFSSSFFVSCR